MAVYFALIAVTLLGVCAIVIDEGYWFQRKAEMQKASDAAVMAGAGALITGERSTADARSRDIVLRITKLNGFDSTNPKYTVTWNNDSANKKLTVSIASPEPRFFGQIYGSGKINLVAAASAIYDYSTQGTVPITGGQYGVNTGPINLGLYGPDQITNRGDLFGTKYTTNPNGTLGLNRQYRPGGYSFAVNIPNNFGNNATLQIYDADSFASGADGTADGKVWDENNKDNYTVNSAGQVVRSGYNVATVTRYTLYSDAGTPYDTSDDELIDSTQVGADSSYDRQWKNFFNWNPNTYSRKVNQGVARNDKVDVNFRVVAQTISGCNENGFNMRVTKPGDTEATFTGAGNGSDIGAIGDIPVNFGKNGTGVVSLGYIPAGATALNVKHFDSDVGVTRGDKIHYSYQSGGVRSQTYDGNPLLGGASDNVTEEDNIALSNYQGGQWQAIYNAGSSDNTTWSVSSNAPTESPGYIRLIN